MGSGPLSSAELAFVQALLIDEGLSKTAEGPDQPDPSTLDPNTRLLLGIPEVDVKEMGSLDERASGYDDELRAPEEAEEDGELAANEEIFGDAPQQVEDAGAVDVEPTEDEIEAPPPPLEGEVVGEYTANEELPPPPDPALMPKPEPVLTKADVGNIFSDPRAHPILLAEVLRAKYDEDWVTWEPETLWWAIRKDFGSVGKLTREKIMALRIALRTDFPWVDWDIFENCCVAWNDHMPIFGAIQLVPPMEAAFGVSILKTLRPEFEFGAEVKAYLGALCEEAGFVHAPQRWFPGAQQLINRKSWIGTLRMDVKSAWAKVKSIPGDQIQQVDFDPKSARDIHIGKLIVVREYLLAREAERKSHPARKAAAAVMSAVA